LEKLYDKHDKTQMEMRKVHGELEKYKNETASLEAEVSMLKALAAEEASLRLPGQP
jgi:uncharacterized membrane-anchored protein YhcB (DUF1043 family)